MKHCSGQIKYLIAIKELSETNDSIRCVNISRHLGVSRPSVSKMLRCLANYGLVYEDFCNSVELTPEGEETAEEIFGLFKEAYVFFHKFLKLPRDEAHSQAVTFISEFPIETSQRLKELVKRTINKRKVL